MSFFTLLDVNESVFFDLVLYSGKLFKLSVDQGLGDWIVRHNIMDHIWRRYASMYIFSLKKIFEFLAD